jgi:hypothetical protein
MLGSLARMHACFLCEGISWLCVYLNGFSGSDQIEGKTDTYENLLPSMLDFNVRR